jgi:anti-sigma B factor antagonist
MGVSDMPASRDVPIPGQLVIESNNDTDSTVLALFGELDLASTPMLEAELAAVESSGAARVVIDLAGVGFMDSTGLQALLRARERAAANDHQFALKRGPHQVQRVFELTKTIDAFTFED